MLNLYLECDARTDSGSSRHSRLYYNLSRSEIHIHVSTFESYLTGQELRWRKIAIGHSLSHAISLFPYPPSLSCPFRFPSTLSITRRIKRNKIIIFPLYFPQYPDLFMDTVRITPIKCFTAVIFIYFVAGHLEHLKLQRNQKKKIDCYRRFREVTKKKIVNSKNDTNYKRTLKSNDLSCILGPDLHHPRFSK